MKKIFLFLFLVIILLSDVFPQKNTRGVYKYGESLINEGKYEDALIEFKKLVKADSENANYNFKLGFLYYLIQNKRDSALIYLKKAQNNVSVKFSNKYSDKTAPPEALFYIGKIYHLNCMFDEAITIFDSLKTITKDKKLSKKIDIEIKECNVGKELINNPINLMVIELAGDIKSDFDDHSPALSVDLNTIIFTSNRKGTGGQKDERDEFFEDIYVSHYDNYKWSKPKSISSSINTNSHEASVSLSSDGNTLLLYKDINEGDLYYSEKKSGVWSAPKSLGKNINSKHREAHASISSDGNYIYFSSNRKGGFGGMDIYMSKKQENGEWGKAVNLGKGINTAFDEEGPYINHDGKTLYFSSNGHSTMGGLDLFKTIKTGEKEWSKPENLGFPANSTSDDAYYVASPDEKMGFYVSNQHGTSGSSNIYCIMNPELYEKGSRFDGEIFYMGKMVEDPIVEVPVKLSNLNNLLSEQKEYIINYLAQSGADTSKLTLKPYKPFDGKENNVLKKNIHRNNTNNLLAFNNPNKNNYKSYVSVLPVSIELEKIYKQNPVVKEVKNQNSTNKRSYSYNKQHIRNRINNKRNLDMKISIVNYFRNKDKDDEIIVVNKRIEASDCEYLFQNINKKLYQVNFNFNMRTTRIDRGLDSISDCLVIHPEVQVELGGHTDSKGSDGYNNILGKNRANFVKSYMLQRGVKPNQVGSISYGEKIPVAPNTKNGKDNEKGRHENRRVELKVIKVDKK